MLEVEDNFVDGSFVTPAHIGEGISEVVARSKVECEQEYLDLADDMRKTARKRTASMRTSHVLLFEQWM